MKHPKLDFDKLYAFTQAVAFGTLTKAAEKMNLSQSSLSRKIMSLQEDLGCALLSYSHKQGIVLTPEGQIVYETAMSLLKQSFDLEAAIKNLREQKRSIISVLITLDFCDAAILDQLRGVTAWRKARQIRVSVDQEAIEQGSYIHITNAITKPSNSSYQKLLTRTYRLYGSRKYLENNGAPGLKSDLPSHRLLALESQLMGKERPANTIFNASDKENEIEPYIIFPSEEMLFEAAAKGYGLAWLPDSWVEQRQHSSLTQVILKDITNPVEEIIYWGERNRGL